MKPHRSFARKSPLVMISLVLACLIAAGAAQVTTAADVTLELIHCWDGYREPWIKEMLDEFEAEHPGVKVVAQLAACGAIKEKTMVGVATGTLADVAMVHSDQIPAISPGLLAVDDFMSREGISRDIWYPSEIAQGDWQGKSYAFPIRTGGDNNNLLFWNKRIFEESGLDGERPPELWSELEEVSKKVVRYDGDTLVQGAFNFSNQPERELGWLYTGGGALFNDDGTNVTIATPEARETLSFFSTLAMSLYRDGREAHRAGDAREFTAERAAMHIKGGSSIAGITQANPDIDLGIGIAPRKTLDSPSGVHAGTWLYAISADTAHPEEAWELLKWLTIRQESAGYFMLRQGRPSPVREFNTDPRYAEINPYWHVIGDALQWSASLPVVAGIRDYIVGWEQAFRAVVFDGAPIESTLENAQNVLQARLDAANSR